MGKQSSAMIDYFSDNERFSGLINGSCFGGREIVRADDLTEGSETYIEEVPQDSWGVKSCDKTDGIRLDI